MTEWQCVARVFVTRNLNSATLNRRGLPFVFNITRVVPRPIWTAVLQEVLRQLLIFLLNLSKVLLQPRYEALCEGEC